MFIVAASTSVPLTVTGLPPSFAPAMSMSVFFAVVVLELFCAAVLSTRLMVTVSPTRRATEFSNSGTSWPAW